MKAFFRKNWSNLFFVILFILLIVPQTRMPIQVFVQRLISFAPSEIVVGEQSLLDDYKWELKTLDGALANLSTSKGNVILINKWATWCPPCVAEMPSLQRLYNSYGDKVTFYFISDETPQKLKRFMTKHGYDFPVFISSTMAPNRLNSNALPTTYVMSKKGRIIMETTGAADWDSEAVHSTLNRLLH